MWSIIRPAVCPKKGSIPKAAEIRGYLAKGISKRSIAKLVECSPSTLYNWLARRNIRTPQHVA